MAYVVNSTERLRDGEESFARLFHTKEAALVWIDKIINGHGGDCHTFQMFELGNEIKLKFDKVMEMQPAKEVKRTVMA